MRGGHLNPPIPVTVVGGYLGAGKTTLVNHLLRQANGLRIAVLVNDFGDLPIDADLIESRDGGVISIAGGCVCCSFGSDLVDGLMRLAARAPVPDCVLIETSGVALPGAVGGTVTLLPAFRLDATVVLADAETVRARAADRYLGDTIARQLAAADLVVLNKTDLVAPGALAALRAWLGAQAPRARLVCAQRARVPPEVLLDAIRTGGRRPATSLLRTGGQLRGAGHDGVTARFESATFSLSRQVDVNALGAMLTQAKLGVLRAKGRLRDLDGAWKILQVVGARHEVSLAAAGSDIEGLVCIGLAGVLDRDALATLVGDGLAAAPRNA